MEILTFLHPGDLGWGFILLFLIFAFLLLVVTPAFIIFVCVDVYRKTKVRELATKKKAE